VLLWLVGVSGTDLGWAGLGWVLGCVCRSLLIARVETGRVQMTFSEARVQYSLVQCSVSSGSIRISSETEQGLRQKILDKDQVRS
jgi:hypothetical protein